jgi:hypothetical protein
VGGCSCCYLKWLQIKVPSSQPPNPDETTIPTDMLYWEPNKELKMKTNLKNEIIFIICLGAVFSISAWILSNFKLSLNLFMYCAGYIVAAVTFISCKHFQLPKAQIRRFREEINKKMKE